MVSKKSVLAMAMTCCISGSVLAETTDLGNIVVTGTKTPHAQKDAPVETTVITAEMIERSGATNITGILKSLSGYMGTNVDQTISYDQTRARFRGLSGDYLLVLVDGQRNWGVGMGGHSVNSKSLSQLPVSMIERVEIVKGAASALYGADAMAGVINIITKTAANKAVTSFKISRGEYQMNSSEGTTDNNKRMLGVRQSSGFNAAVTAPISESTAVAFMFDHRSDEGNAATPQESKADTFRVKANHKVSDALSLDAAIGWEVQQRAKAFGTGIPHLNAALKNRYDRKHDTQSVTLGANYTIDDASNLSASLFYSDHESSSESTKTINEGNFTNLGLDLLYTHYLNDHTLSLGAEVSKDEVKRDVIAYTGGAGATPVVTTGTYKLKADIDRYAVYAQDEISLLNDRWVVVPGVRYEYHSYYGDSITPSLSTRFKITPDTNLRASLGTAFKSPSVTYLYRDGEADHGSEYLRSNKDLKAEKSLNANLGIDHTFSNIPLWISANAFMNNVKDMVAKYDTGETIGSKKVSSYTNLDKVEISGLELAFELGKMDGFYLNGNATFLKTEQTSGADKGKDLQYSPDYSVALIPGFAAKNGRYGIQAVYSLVGEQFTTTDNDKTKTLKSHEVLDASMWVKLGDKLNSPKVSLDLGNLTDSLKGEQVANRYRVGQSVNVSLSGSF